MANNKSDERYVRHLKRTFHTLLLGTTTLYSGEKFWSYLLKLNICVFCDLAISFLGRYPTEVHACAPQKTCTRMNMTTLFRGVQNVI